MASFTVVEKVDVVDDSVVFTVLSVVSISVGVLAVVFSNFDEFFTASCPSQRLKNWISENAPELVYK